MAKQNPKNASLEDWHPADILAALHKRGITLRYIAKQEGLTDSTTLSRAMLNSHPINEIRLAKYAGVPVWQMFPTRWHPDGTKIPRGIRGARQIKSTGFDCQHNGKFQAAA